MLVTVLIYATRFGGDNFVVLTDSLAVVYSFVAIIFGILAVRIYSIKSLQGKTLFMILLGTIIWFAADLIWLLFFRTSYAYVESLRFLGYIPFIAAFFSVTTISDPKIRSERKQLFYLFAIFMVFAVIYLAAIPVIFGSVSIVEVILNNGYIVVDFILLFGVFLLIKTSLAFKKGSLSIGWFIIAVAFISIFVFDVFFAFNFDTYYFGDFIEIFWLFPYLFLSYGFFYHYQSMKNFLAYTNTLINAQNKNISVHDKTNIQIEKTEGNEIKQSIVKKKRNLTPFLIMIISVIIILLLVFQFNLVAVPKISEIMGKLNEDVTITYREYEIEYRDDITVSITKEAFDELNDAYNTSISEYLYCLIGNRSGNKIIINDLSRPEAFYKGIDIIIPAEDPACQLPNSIGTIHSHPGTCEPSQDDIFSWGEMKNPEPIINAIRCNTGFYIVMMPEEHEAFDFRSIRLEVQ